MSGSRIGSTVGLGTAVTVSVIVGSPLVFIAVSFGIVIAID